MAFASLRRRLAAFGKTRPGTIWFVAHNRNHVRLFATAADILALSGQAVAFADLERFYGDEGASREVRRYGRTSLPFAEIAVRAGAGDCIVVANDWGPPPLVDGLVRAAARGALLTGMVEGAKAAEPRRYRLVHRMLALGPASARLFDQPVDIVGSPILDRAFADRTRRETPPFAVINDKFVYDGKAARGAWIAAAERACAAHGLEAQVSAHPSGAAVPEGADFATMMRGAALLVTRPSTVVFEALARGKPVVLFPAEGEPLYEFAPAPGRPFEFAESADALADAVGRAMAPASDWRDCNRAYLADHVTYEPQESAASRIAAALARASGAPLR